MDFLLMLIELFARCYGWGATSEYRLKIGDFANMRSGWRKISCRRGHNNHAFDRRTDGRTPFLRLDRPAFNAAR